MSLALAVRLDIPALAEGAAAPTTAHERAAQRDAELVSRFVGGDRRAFEELVRHYQRSIYYLALRYVRSEADAKDLVQRTFLRAYGALSRFRADSAFRTWLYRIAINLCLNHIRDRRREDVRAAPEPAGEGDTAAAGGPAVDLDARRRGEILRRAIGELPKKQRMVLELRIYEELSFKEVAELVGSTENAAKVNFHHAVKRLRARLGEEEA